VAAESVPMAARVLSALPELEESEWEITSRLLLLILLCRQRFADLRLSRHYTATYSVESIMLDGTLDEEHRPLFGRQPTATRICAWRSRFSTKAHATNDKRTER